VSSIIKQSKNGGLLEFFVGKKNLNGEGVVRS
jgi:hypothetical protein